ncbi:MAG: hypothetical protein GJV46_11765 [Geobacter sp.]|nr:hypothetical protein [Geobacter sp.]
MLCPVCKTHEQYSTINLHTTAFDENIMTCNICSSVWSVNHGLTEVVRDSQNKSFLGATTECVEGDDYYYRFAA